MKKIFLIVVVLLSVLLVAVVSHRWSGGSYKMTGERFISGDQPASSLPKDEVDAGVASRHLSVHVGDTVFAENSDADSGNDSSDQGERNEEGFVIKTISEQWLDENEGKAGRRRIRIVEADFKYPHLRLEESVWTDPQTGKETVQRLRASVADHVLVGLTEGADKRKAVALMEQNGYRVRAVEVGSYLLVEFSRFEDAGDQGRSIAEIEGLDEFIDYAEPDWLVYPCVVPDDPAFTNRKMWGLDNPGFISGTVADADIDAPEGWDIRHSAPNVIVAVTDTGVQYNHEDLAPNMWQNTSGHYGFDAYDDDNDPMDVGGHGTHCAGTIGARGNNGKGLTGVAWEVQLMALRFLGPNGGSTSDAIRVINYARLNGAQVVSASWGGGGYSQSLYNAIKACGDAGIPFVAAAGNDALNNDSFPHYPSSYDLPTIVAVASTTSRDKLSTFSCYGRYSVDIAAPGSDIWSCYVGSNTSYKHLNGTSMATPHVSGALALAVAHFPDDDVEDLIARLYSSVDSVPALTGKVATGGRLNLAKLLGASTAGVNNDDFENALRFDGEYGYWSGSNRKATREDDEDNFSLSGTGSRSVWFAWKAPYQGLVEFQVKANAAPLRVIAFRGDQKDELAIASDGGAFPVTDSKIVRFYSVEGQEYRFLVDSTHATGQNLLVNLELKPSNDNFIDAIQLSSNRFSARGSNRNATAEPVELEAPHAGVGRGKSVWWKWTPDFDGEFVISTQGSEFDTVLAVYTGSDQNNLTEIAANDDRNSLDWTSQASFTVVSGTTYYIAVDGYRNDASGGILLNGFLGGQLLFLQEPESRLVKLNSTVDMSVIASGASNITYQWYKDGQPIAGARRSIFTISNVNNSDFGLYHVTASDGISTIVSQQAHLQELRQAPVIVWSPTSFAVAAGQSLTIAPRVRGSEVLAYQWYKDNAVIPGATSASLAFGSITVSDTGRYHLEVSNDLGAVKTNPINVSVLDIPWASWQWRFPRPQGYPLQDVAYAEGHYVAVGDAGMIITSPDGNAWTIRGLGNTSYRFKRIVRGAGFWIACDYAGNFAKSTDLVTWTSYTVTEFGPSQIVADVFGWKNKLYYLRYYGGVSTLYESTDGVTWNNIREFSGKQYNRAMTSPSTLVLVERSSNDVLSTTNLINWTRTTTDPEEGTAMEKGIGCYSQKDNQFMVWSELYGRSRLWTSPDGIDWSFTDYGTYAFWQGSPVYDSSLDFRIFEHAGKYYFVRKGFRYVFSSSSGTEWTKHDYHDEINALVGGSDEFVIVSDNGTTSAADKVENLYIEEPSTYGFTESFRGVKVISNRAWAYSSENRLFSSSDGTVWTNEGKIEASSPVNNLANNHVNVESLIYANGYYWAGQTNTSISYKIFRGNDPSSMVEQVDSNLEHIKGLAFKDGRFVAIAHSGIHFSLDGITWFAAPAPVPGYVNYKAIGAIGNRFVAVDDQGRIYSSLNGVTWTYVNTGKSVNFGTTHFAFGLNSFLVLFPDSSIWRSQDGVTWQQLNITAHLNDAADPISAVTGNDDAVIFFARNRAVYSENFTQWYGFDISTTSVSGAIVLADSIIATGGGTGVNTSLHILQGGTPKSFAPVARLVNIADDGRYLVNSRLKIYTEVFDPEGQVVNTKLYVNGTEIGSSTSDSPLFEWYPTEVGRYIIKLVASDAGGVYHEDVAQVEVIGAAVLGTGIDMGSARKLNVIGDRVYLTGNGGRFGVMEPGGSIRNIVLPTGTDLRSVEYNEGVYVVGGKEVFASFDGFTWNYIPNVVGEIEQSDGKFIVRDSGGKFFWVSDDGFSWSKVIYTNAHTAGGFTQVVLAFGKYWIISNKRIKVSENGGKTWIDTGVLGERIVKWDNKLCTASAGKFSQTSDGENWSESVIPDVGFERPVLSEAGGMLFLGHTRGFVSNMNDYKLVYSSSDGVQWTPVVNAGNYHDIVYGGNLWVKIGSTSAYSSSDGVHWTHILGSDSSVTIPEAPIQEQRFNATRWELDYHPDFGFVAIGNTWHNLIYASSIDGRNWDVGIGESLQSSYWTDITVKDTRACIVRSNKIEWSDDFSAWNVAVSQIAGNVRKLKAVNGSFAYTTSAGYVGFSTDGITWESHLIAQGVNCQDIAYGGGKYFVVAGAKGYLSTDKINWTEVDLPTNYRRVTYANNRFMVHDSYSSAPRLAYSEDGVTWTAVTDIPWDVYISNIKSVSYGSGGYFVADGGNGAFTPDFVTWTRVTFEYPTTLYEVYHEPGEGFTLLSSRGIYKSTNGTIWTGPNKVMANAQFLIRDGNDTYVASQVSTEIFTEKDIELVAVTAPSTNVGVGDNVSIQLEIKNHSTHALHADIPVFDVIATNDGILGNSDDFPIGEGIPLGQSIPAGATSIVNKSIEIPNNVIAGRYRLAVRVASQTGYRELNNINNIKLTADYPVTIPEWSLSLDTNGNGQINRNFVALRYPHKARVSLTANAGKGATFAGWGGDAVGAENQITILMDGNKSVQANFSSRANLQMLVRGHGTVTGVADLGGYPVGGIASVMAVPANDWVFSHWSGAATGNSTSTNVTMDSNKVLVATFIKPMSTWRSEHFTPAELLDVTISGDDADPDGDGLKNWQEYLHLSNPRSRGSKGIIETKVAGGYLYIIFTRNSGIEGALSLACQGSRDMSDWDVPDIQERVLSSASGVETIEARIPTNGQQQGYIRLKYTRP